MTPDCGLSAAAAGADSVGDAVAGRSGLRSSGVAGPGPDRHLSPEIETCVDLVRSGAVLAAATSVIGDLA